MKGQTIDGEKIFANKILIKNLHPEYTKNSQNPIIKTSNKTISKRFEWTLYQSRYIIDNENILNIFGP